MHNLDLAIAHSSLLADFKVHLYTAGMTLEDVRKYEDELQQQTNARVVEGLNTQEAS